LRSIIAISWTADCHNTNIGNDHKSHLAPPSHRYLARTILSHTKELLSC
jgi:hypothetical protein